MMIVPMDTPGVTVRPLIQATGDHGFNEVFCDDVRVPLDNVVGEINDGWRVALSMLMNERVALGASGNSLVSGRADVLIEAAKALGATTHLVVRQALIDVYIREQVLRFVALRVRAAVESGHAPGAEGSIAKLHWSESNQRLTKLALELLGPASQLDDGGGWWAECMAVARVLKAESGSHKLNYEIHGNTIPHLHMHLFPRMRSDFGRPLPAMDAYRRSAADLARIANAFSGDKTRAET